MPSVNPGPASLNSPNVQALQGAGPGLIAPTVRPAAAGLAQIDSGLIIVTNDATAQTLVIGARIPVGWNAMVIQGGDGQVTFAGAGVTLRQAAGLTMTAQKYSAVSLLAIAENEVVLGGDMA